MAYHELSNIYQKDVHILYLKPSQIAGWNFIELSHNLSFIMCAYYLYPSLKRVVSSDLGVRSSVSTFVSKTPKHLMEFHEFFTEFLSYRVLMHLLFFILIELIFRGSHIEHILIILITLICGVYHGIYMGLATYIKGGTSFIRNSS